MDRSITLSASNEKKYDEQDGKLVLHNQTSCSSPATIDESKSGVFLGNFMSMNQVDETASWLESEFEEFLSGVRNPDSINKVQRCVKFNSTKDTDGSQNSLMLPPRPHLYDSSNHSPSPKTSNNERLIEEFLLENPQICHPEMTFDQMISSSSGGGSGCRFRGAGKQTAANHGHKRKERVLQESGHHIENVEQETLEASKQAQKTAPSRRNRAAELHNLSERRRRDGINEKLKALQELIPHHYKSDKASMLEEAIGYLKSLQLQLQILWMGGGMVPMVFPGSQQYIPSMGVEPPLPSFQNRVQLPGETLLNQFMMPFSAPNLPMVCPSPGIAPLRYPNQLPNVRLPEPFPHYFGFPITQMPNQVKVRRGPGLKDTRTIL